MTRDDDRSVHDMTRLWHRLLRHLNLHHTTAYLEHMAATYPKAEAR